MATATAPISHPATQRAVVPELVLAAASEFAGAAEFAPSRPNPEVNELFAKALSAQKKGNHTKAIARYTEIIGLHPQTADVYINRGAAYESAGDHNLALQDLNTAVGLEPKFMAYFNRASVYFKQSEYERSIRDYSAALEIDSKSARAYIYRGQTYSNLSLYDRAIRDFNKALDLNPSSAIAHTGIGIVHSSMGDHDNAIKNYSHALKIDRDYPFAYLNRGASYSAKGDRDRAVMDFSKALELNPEYSDAYAIRGLTLMGQGEYDRALWDLNRALQLNPHDPYAHAIRGSLYLNKGDLVRAVRDFDEALTRTPDNNIAYNYRGLAYEQKGDLARAMQDYDQALSIRPDQTVFACRGIALLRLSRWDEAKSDLLSARNMGMDLVSVFRADHGSVAAFEEKHNLKLPQDIADLVSVEEAPQPAFTRESILDLFERIRKSVPSDTWDELPTDLVKNKKHYLYGHPKVT